MWRCSAGCSMKNRETSSGDYVMGCVTHMLNSAAGLLGCYYLHSECPHTVTANITKTHTHYEASTCVMWCGSVFCVQPCYLGLPWS